MCLLCIYEYANLPITVTLKEQLTLFPLPSTASQVTRVFPMVNSTSDCASQVTETFPELSEADGSPNVTTAVGFPSSV